MGTLSQSDGCKWIETAAEIVRELLNQQILLSLAVQSALYFQLTVLN